MTTKTKSASFATLVATGLFLATSAPAHALAYSFTDLGSLGGGSMATAINASGQIVGFSYFTDDPYHISPHHAVLWNGTTATDLGTLGGTESIAHDINASGQIVGESSITGNLSNHAVLWNGTTATDLGTLGGTYSVAHAINASGQVAGWSTINDGTPSHATLWNGSSPTDLNPGPGGDYSRAFDINDQGHVVGESLTTGHITGATLWNGTTPTDLDPGGSFSWAHGINNSGQIAGFRFNASDNLFHFTLWNGTVATEISSMASEFFPGNTAYAINALGQAVVTIDLGGPYVAGLWDGTTLIDLNTLLDADSVSAGWVLTYASDINDNGWIVGNAYNRQSNTNRAFLMKPVPIPATAWLFASAMLARFSLKKRKINLSWMGYSVRRLC